MSETKRLALPLMAEAQAQKHVTHNEALLKLDAIVQLSVRSRGLADPPDAPADGDAWIVAAGGTGQWNGHDGEIALRQSGAWVFHAPRTGWVAWVEDERRLVTHDGSGWAPVDATTLDGRPASEYVLAGQLDGASVGNADTVDGRHAEEFALLSGAIFTGGVTAPGFSGDGGGLTNVNADYLGGQSPEAYACIAGAAFTGEVSAARFSGDGSGLTDVDAAMLAGQEAGEYVLRGELAMASVGNADTVDGRHAEEFALLSGATFTGGVTAAGFTGDGGGLSNVDAAYLGGLSPEAYALLSGADFTGEVSAARFSGDGGGLTNVDAASLGGRPNSDYVLASELAMASVGNADTVDGRHADEFALLSGATFTGRLGAQNIYVGRPELDRSAGRGAASIELGGWSGTWSCNVQDGTGRVNFRWNATAGPQPAFLVDGDRAVEWDIDGWGGFGLTIRESGINTGAGSPVSFEAIFSAGRRGIKGFVPFILPSYSIAALPDAAWLGAGALLFVPDGGNGPMVAFSDGTYWRRMNDGEVIT